MSYAGECESLKEQAKAVIASGQRCEADIDCTEAPPTRMVCEKNTCVGV
jgi:hypothetical protein